MRSKILYHHAVTANQFLCLCYTPDASHVSRVHKPRHPIGHFSFCFDFSCIICYGGVVRCNWATADQYWWSKKSLTCEITTMMSLWHRVYFLKVPAETFHKSVVRFMTQHLTNSTENSLVFGKKCKINRNVKKMNVSVVCNSVLDFYQTQRSCLLACVFACMWAFPACPGTHSPAWPVREAALCANKYSPPPLMNSSDLGPRCRQHACPKHDPGTWLPDRDQRSRQ